MNTKNLYYEGLGQSLLKPMNYKKQVLHSYVDLGLLSGTLWATMNVGASSETDYGNYYMYGMGSKTYDSTDMPYAGTEDPLDLSKDTARQVWGGDWHMPTQAQMQELTANTTYQWVTDYKGSGINGGTFTATNGAVLFLPAAGDWYGGSLEVVGNGGNYWGSSPDGSNSACDLYFNNGGKDVSSSSRDSGYSVRPVIDGTPESRVVLIYNTENENEIMLNPGSSNLNLIYDDIEVDGQSILIPETTDLLDFNSLGKHTVKLTLKDPTSLVQNALHESSATYIYLPPSITFLDYTSIAYCDKLTHVDFYDISGSATCNFVNCPNLDADTLNRLSILFPNGYGEGYCD